MIFSSKYAGWLQQVPVDRDGRGDRVATGGVDLNPDQFRENVNALYSNLLQQPSQYQSVRLI
jgi:hypothetical protein